MSLLTNWGYTLTDVTELPGILSTADFNELTASKYASDARVSADIAAAESAVRNYCGWHVYPSAACELSTTFFDRRITKVFGGILIQLPATYVTAVSSVTIGGTAYTTYVLDPNGLLRVYGVDWSELKLYSTVAVEYTAGLPSGMAANIMELIAHRVTHALASSAGVQSEAAGGVSITYSSNWINNSRATALADDNKEVLTPYRLGEVF